MKIPFNRPSITQREIDEVVDTLKSGWLTTGPKTKKFEQKFAEYVGAKYAVAVNSCTAAMHLALAAFGIQPGDEVITTPYTFAASAEVILYMGATPVFVDIDEATFNIDPDKIEAAVTKKTKAILPVHIAGYPADMDRIMEIADRHHLRVLEDAAHAIESRYGDRKIGSIGDATAFSFYATKNLVTGEGGMLTTDDPEIENRARILSLHGMSRDAWKRYDSGGSWYYEIIAQGFKYNMTDIQAALGLVQQERIDEMRVRRLKIVRQYQDAFHKHPELITPQEATDSTHAWHLYLLRLSDDCSVPRNQFIERLNSAGISPSVHFIPLHIMPLYQKLLGVQSFPVAEKIYSQVVTLPLFYNLTDEEVAYIIDTVRRSLRRGL